MFQRTSLYWQLSELSPVWIAKENGVPVAGPFFCALTACTIASATWAESISWGRYDDENSPGVSNRSTHSTRAGDSCVDDVDVAELDERLEPDPPVACVRPGPRRRGRCARWRTSPGPVTILE